MKRTFLIALSGVPLLMLVLARVAQAQAGPGMAPPITPAVAAVEAIAPYITAGVLVLVGLNLAKLQRVGADVKAVDDKIERVLTQTLPKEYVSSKFCDERTLSGSDRAARGEARLAKIEEIIERRGMTRGALGHEDRRGGA